MYSLLLLRVIGGRWADGSQDGKQLLLQLSVFPLGYLHSLNDALCPFQMMSLQTRRYIHAKAWPSHCALGVPITARCIYLPLCIQLMCFAEKLISNNSFPKLPTLQNPNKSRIVFHNNAVVIKFPFNFSCFGTKQIRYLRSGSSFLICFN